MKDYFKIRMTWRIMNGFEKVIFSLSMLLTAGSVLFLLYIMYGTSLH